MAVPEFKTFSFHLSPRHKVLAGVIAVLALAIVVLVLLAAASVAAILALGGAALALGAGAIAAAKSLFGGKAGRLDHSRRSTRRLDHLAENDLDPAKRIDYRED